MTTPAKKEGVTDSGGARAPAPVVVPPVVAPAVSLGLHGAVVPFNPRPGRLERIR